MPTLPDVLLYLGVDEVDEFIERNVLHAMAAAKATLYGAVGEDVEEYLPADPRVDELIYTYVDDLYSNRGVSAKVGGSVRRLVHSMEQQLRLELKTAKEQTAQ